MSIEDGQAIAVIGMAARLPGGVDLSGYWSAMLEGRELLTRTGDAVYGAVPGGDEFDAAFFGYPPSEALLLDPQQRVFLECAWEALEHAGHVPGSSSEVIGVYGGCGDTDHLDQLRAHRDRFPEVSELQFRLSASPDFLTSRVAYKLNLTGPAITVQTACSTSLVAVHTAVQSLLAGDCDIALAGGITLHASCPTAEVAEASISSPSGHCRAFDADADGTVASDGAGIVVLRRLEDALAGRDQIHALIVGSAVSNDGAAKVGFTAPSVAGQAAAIRSAHLVADVEPTSISYLEAHGTGTAAGDPIEIRALRTAFGTTDPGFCLLGTAKTNIGHTDAAAGVLGLIRVILALRHQIIPAHPHFRRANPDLELDSSPFRVNTTAEPWPRTQRPRRAGVNSVGLGGTNAHCVVEEPPLPNPSPGRSHQLLLLSAQTPQALAQQADRLATFLSQSPAAVLPDVAWTLQTGRRHFPHRGFVVADGPAAAVDVLTGRHASRVLRTARLSRTRPPETVFLFPGQGGQHLGMGAELYAQEPIFRDVVDSCADASRATLGLDLRDLLITRADDGAAQARLATMVVGQVTVFTVEYALARLWISLGVRPAAVLGHSLGAYAAAAVAEVMTLPDALALVAERGRILDSVPSGAMLAISLNAEQALGLIGPQLSLAAINAPDQCVVAGAEADILALQARLAAEGVENRRLHISTASHSHLVEPMLARYESAVAGVRLNPPVLPLVSDRTGKYVSTAEAVDPSFWSRHLREPVNFSGALGTVLGPDTVLLELGPGRTLTGLAHRHPAFGAGNIAAASMPHPADGLPGTEVLLTAMGTLWQAGVDLDWTAVHSAERRYRTALPSYPFQRVRFSLDQPAPEQPVQTGEPDLATSPLERSIAEAFGSILGIPGLAADANFFELGGDSLLALRVTALLRREAGLEVSVPTIFRAPTVAGLARLLDGQPTDRSEPSGWLLCQRRYPDAAERLYCLPHSGGSATEFLTWSHRLPELEVCGIEPPGRGHRLHEKAFTCMEDLIDALVEQVDLCPPYLLFGHSLGAAVAYELTVALQGSGKPLPERLFVSAHEAPHRPRQPTGLAELDDAGLLSEIERQYGSLPAELHTDRSWRAATLTGLRADLQIVDGYHRREPEPLCCPITAIGGSADSIAEPDLRAWQECTTAGFELHLIPGGHFYFREHADDLFRVLTVRTT